MPMHTDTAGLFICEAGDWEVSNLKLQKVLYIAQMAYLGLHGERLADTSFQAWDLGPVAPRVYRQVRMFGARPIQNVFSRAEQLPDHDERRKILADVCRDLLSLSPSELVELTHWERGAWARHYEPGVRNVPIPDESIIGEFRAAVEEGFIQV